MLLKIILGHTPKTKWTGSILESFKYVGNTNKGEIGEEFIRQFLAANNIRTEHGSRVDKIDMLIFGKKFEVKTASEGEGGTFQFNHVRLDRSYNYLLCLGICPKQIVFNAWSKGCVAENKAGKLVRMAEGQGVTFKITKKLDDLLPISQLPIWMHSNLQEEL